MSEEKQFCPKCGKEVKTGETFCGECGAKLKTEAIENPSIISSIGNVSLTKNYVCKYYSMIGKEYFMYIFLKDISSIKFYYKSLPIFILLAVISIIIGCCNRYYSETLTICTVLAILFIITFFVTRKRVIEIAAHNNQKIVEVITGSEDSVKSFVKKLVETKGENC